MAALLHSPQHLCLNLLSGQFHASEVSISFINLTLILHNSKFLIRPFSYGLLVWPCGILGGPASQKNVLPPPLRPKWVMWKYSWIIRSRGKRNGPLDRSNPPRYLNRTLTQVTRYHPETGGNIPPAPENRYPLTKDDGVVPVHKIKECRRNVDIAPLILNTVLGGAHSVKMQKATGHVLYQFSPKRTFLDFTRQEMIEHLYQQLSWALQDLGGKYSYWKTRFPFWT